MVTEKKLPGTREDFVMVMQQDLMAQKAHTRLTVEKLAAALGIADKTEVKELTELAIVRCARELAQGEGTIRERYDKIVSLYKSQVNLSHRTSMSMLLQQYSTPAPIGYLMGIFAGLDHLGNGRYGFEPSAGNGLLTIAGDPRYITVNEVDDLRRRNLETQGYQQVWNTDASEHFSYVKAYYNAVVTNPPFGTLPKPVYFDTYKIDTLDGLMALRALEAMTTNGRAAVIMGGHTVWGKHGRIQGGRNRIFFNYLYNRYRVIDVINVDGHKLYSRMGTAFNTRIILIAGRKVTPEGVAPLYNPEKDKIVSTFGGLYERFITAMQQADKAYVRNDKGDRPQTKPAMDTLEQEALAYLKLLEDEGLGATYVPASDACVVLDTQVPDSMAFETQQAVEQIEQAVGGDIDNFVRDRLGYRSKRELCKALSAEQIDAVAMAIYNIEARGQGMVIGDQTGIGKGRVAASMIRYACEQGLTPVFITEKANLFSDIYRDLAAIGSGRLRPFIVNAQESKSDIKDEDGHVIYRALPPAEQQAVFVSGRVPVPYDFVCATYSQFNSAEKKPLKPNFLKAIAEDNIFIMDEAHNSSGASQTGIFLQEVVRQTRGVTFLSATFAKRPDNMPIYALRTAISDSNLDNESLVHSIRRGGVALQEILSAQLVQEGQMLRRERSYDGVEVNYITLEDKAAEHWAISDNITQVIRDIIAFQKDFISHEVAQLDEEKAREGEEVALREGTSEAGVDNEPYFSKVFQVVNQMLFSLKAEAVAQRAILRLKEGKKTVIAFASTMGSFIEDLIAQSGQPYEEGMKINTDFSQVLRKGLQGVLRYTVYEPDGTPSHQVFDINELPLLAQIEYKRIATFINSVSTGITISPIDVVIKRIREAGYTIAEVTGRKYTLELEEKNMRGIVTLRKRINTNDAFRLFNNNEADVLLINQAGSTGASAHAIATAKVPASEVKQRVMIVQQPELDINTEVQKRGRINRTGQLFKPIYDYVSTAIPAEMRLMMILQKKLKSLDANTTSNQKQSTKILNVPDFLNKFGDEVVANYLNEHEDINKILDYPVKRNDALRKEGESIVDDAASKTCGRVAVLSAKMQQDFYNEVSGMYEEYVDYLKQTGDYDLEVEAMDLEAETEATSIIKMGKGGRSVFGKDSMLERVKVNVLKKPFTPAELNNILNESLGGRTAGELEQELQEEFLKYGNVILEEERQDINAQFDRLVAGIQSERKIAKLAEDMEAWHMAIARREKELEEDRQKKLAQADKKASDRKFYLNKILPFFLIGQNLYYPIRFGMDTELIPTVFLGYQIDWKKKNPFAPSNIKLRFALADSHKYLVIPASNKETVMAVMGASEKAEPPDRFALLDNWEEWIKQGSVDRQTRYIITGNLLQAFADHPGKLISYTTIDQQVKKSILLPEHWNPKEQLEDKVTVPVIKALPLIQSLTQGSSMVTNTGISFFRESEARFKVIVSASRSASGDIFLNPEILQLVTGNNFEKRADKMVAYIGIENMPQLIKVIQQINNCAVSIPYAQLKFIKQDVISSDRKSIRMPEPEPTGPTPEEEELALLELEAEAVAVALALELELYGRAA
jgi:hypothetical protein